MREIKFRFWNILKKEMMDDLQIDVTTCNVFNTNTALRLESCIPLQFIGLKDKNGKEIYEGDIVNFESFLAGTTWQEVVEDIRFFPRNLPHEQTKMEVIGNKFENPELLK